VNVNNVDFIVEFGGIANKPFSGQFRFNVLHRYCRPDVAQVYHDCKYTA